MNRPQLYDFIPSKFEDIPQVPCYKAGYLTTKNAGWRNMRPVVDEQKCAGCLQCYMVCPDGTIYKNSGKVAVDYDFCKGCGICAKQCSFGAITMEAEK